MTHQTISFIKSVLRIVGYVGLVIDLQIAVVLLVGSEIVGILEEVGE